MCPFWRDFSRAGRASIVSGRVVADFPLSTPAPRLLPLQPSQAEKIPYMSGVDLTIHSSTTSSSARRSIVGDRKSRGKSRAEGRPSLVGLPSGDGLFNGVNRMRWTTILSTLALLMATATGCEQQCFLKECDEKHS